MTHWAARYIGTPWVAGESDCWHFACRVWAERFGWAVPPVPTCATDPRAARRAFAEAPQATGWVPVAGDPGEGDGVLMAKGRYPCHVGVAIALPEGAAVLHSVESAGVIVTPMFRLPDLGFRVVGLYRRAA